MWPTLQQWWKNWYILIIALCLMILPVLLFTPEQNTRTQAASQSAQSNKTETPTNVVGEKTPPHPRPVQAQKPPHSPSNHPPPPPPPPQPQKTAQDVPAPTAPSQPPAAVNSQDAPHAAPRAQTT